MSGVYVVRELLAGVWHDVLGSPIGLLVVVDRTLAVCRDTPMVPPHGGA
jgi:hypothetical protein